MANISSKPKAFLSFIIIILVAGVGYYLYAKNSANKSSDQKPSPTETIDESIKEVNKINVSGALVYTNTSSDSTEIYSITPLDGSRKKIFTDTDENSKILQAQSITKDGKNILVTMSPKNSTGNQSLWVVNTGKGEKTELINNFASSVPPAISGDGKKVAYTVFSNAERDYGFTLLVSAIDGLNKVKLDNDGFSISCLAFSPNNDYVAYTKSTDNSKVRSAIYKSKVDGTEVKEIYQTGEKEIIYSLDWTNDQIAFSKGPTGNNNLNKSEIYTITDDGKNLKQITNNDYHENFINFSADGKNIAYLAITYEDNPQTAAKSGEIHIYSLEDKKDNNLNQQTDRIIGWIP